MKSIVIIESPYKGKTQIEKLYNQRYLRKCLHDSLIRGEAPFASHALYTLEGVLNDDIPKERKLGIDAGHRYLDVCDKVVVYIDRGISSGMKERIDLAKDHGIEIEYRTLPEKEKRIEDEQ